MTFLAVVIGTAFGFFGVRLLITTFRIDPTILAPAAGPRVFISYSSKNNKDATYLEVGLREYGILPWIDVSQRLLGTPLVDNISRTMQTVDAVIILVTPASRCSNWVKLEIEYAVEAHIQRGIRIIPIVMDDEPIPATLKAFAGKVTNVVDSKTIEEIAENCKYAWHENSTKSKATLKD